MVVKFDVGETFNTFPELEKKINDFEKSNCVKLWKRDSRTIQSAVKNKRISAEKAPSVDDQDELRYYEIHYACVHGGRTHKSASKGARTAHTFRNDCPFNLSLRLTDDGKSLSVRSINTEHNHIAIEETYKYYPSVRRLSDDQLAYAQQQLALNANKKKLQHQLELDTGKSVLLKDINNIATIAKKRDNITRNDLDACIDELRRVHRCMVDVCTSQENDFCGLFVQDSKMKQTFSAFPEIIFLDATYKLLELQFPVYVFACEDSNGATHIIGLGANGHRRCSICEVVGRNFPEAQPKGISY